MTIKVNVNHVLNRAILLIGVAWLLASTPSRATVIPTITKDWSDVASFVDDTTESGASPIASSDPSWDASSGPPVSVDAMAALAHGRDIKSIELIGRAWGFPEPAGNTLLDIALSAMSGQAGGCGGWALYCDADGLHNGAGRTANAELVLALMPPGAGGRVVNTSLADISDASAQGAEGFSRTGDSDRGPVPEPVLLALLALGLVVVSTGVRKFLVQRAV